MGCPIQGAVEPAAAADVGAALHHMGCYEVCVWGGGGKDWGRRPDGECARRVSTTLHLVCKGPGHTNPAPAPLPCTIARICSCSFSLQRDCFLTALVQS